MYGGLPFIRKILCGYGNYGDLGIDVIVDQNRQIWLLEINKFHEHDIGLYVDSATGLYERIVITPLRICESTGWI